MSKKQRKQKNKTKTEEFQTSFSKADWYGTGRSKRNKKHTVNNKINKKNQPDLNATTFPVSLPQLAESDEARAVSGLLVGNIEPKQEK
jgi:hypothetical protein